jgi:hypothetical protein
MSLGTKHTVRVATQQPPAHMQTLNRVRDLSQAEIRQIQTTTEFLSALSDATIGLPYASSTMQPPIETRPAYWCVY